MYIWIFEMEQKGNNNIKMIIFFIKSTNFIIIFYIIIFHLFVITMFKENKSNLLINFLIMRMGWREGLLHPGQTSLKSIMTLYFNYYNIWTIIPWKINWKIEKCHCIVYGRILLVTPNFEFYILIKILPNILIVI